MLGFKFVFDGTVAGWIKTNMQVLLATYLVTAEDGRPFSRFAVELCGSKIRSLTSCWLAFIAYTLLTLKLVKNVVDPGLS
jgi:hypothetical protein